MKLLILALSVAVALATVPELNVIKTHTFDKSYSCDGSYAVSALSLVNGSYSPDVLFDGACKSSSFFSADFGGSDFAVLAKLGAAKSFPLENVTANAAFNYQSVVGHDNIFTKHVMAEPDTTYVVLRTESPMSKPGAVRTLFAFETTGNCLDSSKPCPIRYAVLDYTVQRVLEQSPGFDWQKRNA